MYPLGVFFRISTEFRRNEQLDVYFLGSGSDFLLNVESCYRNGTDDNVHTSQGVLDGLVIGIVDLDHPGVTLNRGLGALGMHSQCLLSHIRV